MTINKQARKHSSTLTQQLLSEVSATKLAQSSNKMVLAARIDDLITSKNWSKSEFAEKIGQQPSVVSKWLSGTHNFTLDTMTAIAVIFQMTLQELIAPERAKGAAMMHVEVTLYQDRPGTPYITPVANSSMLNSDVYPLRSASLASTSC